MDKKQKVVLFYCTPTEAQRKSGKTGNEEEAKKTREEVRKMCDWKEFAVHENSTRAEIIKRWEELKDYDNSCSPDYPKINFAVPHWMYEMIMDYEHGDPDGWNCLDLLQAERGQNSGLKTAK